MSLYPLDVPRRPAPDRRHTGEQGFITPPTLSRNSSTSSLISLRSDPGRPTAYNNTNTSSESSSQSSKPSSFSRFFSGHSNTTKPKKEKKQPSPQVLTSRHAAAVRARLLGTSLNKPTTTTTTTSRPVVLGTQHSAHLTAHEQEFRYPHSGPPALRASKPPPAPLPTKTKAKTKAKATPLAPKPQPDLPVLTRIASGDEVDEPDEWQRMRDEWRARKIPGIEMLQVLEGEALGGGSYSTSTSGTTTPDDRERERDGKYISMSDSETTTNWKMALRPKPVRRHTPIGSRWRKDENGVWTR